MLSAIREVVRGIRESRVVAAAVLAWAGGISGLVFSTSILSPEFGSCGFLYYSLEFANFLCIHCWPGGCLSARRVARGKLCPRDLESSVGLRDRGPVLSRVRSFA